MGFALLLITAMLGSEAPAEPAVAVLCTARPSYVNRLDATTVEFATRDGLFRTVGDAARTQTMLRRLMFAAQDHAEFTPGVRVIERRGGITYVDEVTYDARCANAFAR